MPRGLAPDTCFLSVRSGDYRASSGLEEYFFVFSGLGSVFLLSQSMSDTAQVGHKASSWHRLDGKGLSLSPSGHVSLQDLFFCCAHEQCTLPPRLSAFTVHY